MTTLQIYVAAFCALCLIAVFAYRLSVWIDRRRQRDQQATLDTVVEEERRLSLVLDDPTDEPLEVDPPVVPRYLGIPYQFDGDRLRDRPLPPIGGVWS